MRLRNAEQRRRPGLRQPAPCNQFVDLYRELHAQSSFASVGKCKINEDIAAPDLKFELGDHRVRSRASFRSPGGRHLAA